VLACVLLAVAAVPPAAGEGSPSRPVAALVVRLSAAAAHSAARVATVQRRVTTVQRRAASGVPAASPVARRERHAPLAPPARFRGRADERYLYATISKFLC
jgi:hypothetical protein